MNPSTNVIESTNPIDGRGLVPLKDATRWLGLHDARVVMRLVREGRLRAIRVGNRVLVTGRSLREFVEG